VKKNLAIVITRLEMGGAQKIVLSLYKKLDRTKFNVYLITGKSGYFVKELANIKDDSVQLWNEIKHPISPITDLKAIFKMTKFFIEKKIDIVNTHCSKAGAIGRLAAKLAGINNVIYTVHGFSFHPYQNPISHFIYLLIEKILAWYTKIFIAVGQDIKQYGISKRIGNDYQYRVIPAAIDTELFMKKRNVRNEFLLSYGLKPDCFTVGMIGNMKKQKNAEEFVEIACLACNEDKNIQFILAGNGNPQKEEKLKRKIISVELEKRIKLIGWADKPEEFLASIDVFILTSRWEGLPCTIMQSYCTGIPFVATDIPGNSELQKYTGTGSLYEPGNILSAKNEIFRIRMNKFEPLKNIVEEFDENRMIEKYESEFDELFTN